MTASKAMAGSQQGRIPELDGLRAFAILPVLLVHGIAGQGPFRVLAPIFKTGWIGVDLFFVLSGYLITGILLDTAGSAHYYRNFIVRRALRILPLYYACLAAMTAYSVLDKARWEGLVHWGNPAWFAFYLGNLRIAAEGANPPVYFYSPLWSLQVEEQFYLLYPLLVAVCTLPRLRRVLTACVVAGPLLRGLCLLLFPGNAMLPYVLTPCRMDALALGGLVAVTMRDGGLPLSAAWLRRCLVAGAAACAAMFVFVSGDWAHPFVAFAGHSILDLTCAALLAVVVAAPWPAMASLLRWRPLVYTGQIAYGLYLLHLPASAALRAVVSIVAPVRPGGSVNSVLICVASFAAAALSWRYFERRVLALKDRFTCRSVEARLGEHRQELVPGPHVDRGGHQLAVAVIDEALRDPLHAE